MGNPSNLNPGFPLPRLITRGLIYFIYIYVIYIIIYVWYVYNGLRWLSSNQTNTLFRKEGHLPILGWFGNHRAGPPSADRRVSVGMSLGSSMGQGTKTSWNGAHSIAVSILVLLCGWDDPAWVWTCGIAPNGSKWLFLRQWSTDFWITRSDLSDKATWLSGFVGWVRGNYGTFPAGFKGT